MSEIPCYDPQLNFAKYLEINKYNFPGVHLHNPLLNLIPTSKSDIMLPHSKLSNDNLGLCNQILSVNHNRTDRKPVNCVKMFSNSKKVLYGTTNGNLVTCDIYNSFSLNNAGQLNTTASIRAMQWNKPETCLLTGDGAGTIHYFNSSIKAKQILKQHNDTITDISFSITDNKFVTSSDDKTCKIFDFETGIEDIIFEEHLSDVKTCDWNPYKNIVASGGKDQTIKIWDPSSREVIDTLHPHKNSINRLRFNKNGNWLLSASKDHLLKIIDIRMMKELQTFKGHDTEVNTMVWHPIFEEIFCSAGADKNIIYWKVGQNKHYKIENAHEKEIFDLCFNKMGTLLASGSNDSLLKFWIRSNNPIY